MRARSVLFAAYLWASAAAVGFLCLPALARREWSLAVSKAWARSVLWALRATCGLGYAVEGADRLPHGAGLLAVKHQAMWETVALTALLERPCFVLKKELRAIPVFGWYCRANGFVFVDRKDGARALRAMTAAARRAADEGAQVVIFPEGTRARVGEALPYHPGVAALARATGLPVVPVAHDAGRYWTHPGLLRRPGTITMRVLDEIPPGTPRRELMTRLRDEVEAATRTLEGADG